MLDRPAKWRIGMVVVLLLATGCGRAAPSDTAGLAGSTKPAVSLSPALLSPSPSAPATPTPAPVATSTPTLALPITKVPVGAALRILTKSMPAAVEGVPYAFQFTAGGGSPPYRWSWVSNPFPCCVNLETSGRAAGTFGVMPVKPVYVHNFTLLVADQGGQTATANLSISISGVYISPRTFPPATVGQSYGATFQINGGTPPYTLAPGPFVNALNWGLPPGIRVGLPGSTIPNGGACDLSTSGSRCGFIGTPTARGVYTTTIGASDASGMITDWMTFSITVN